MVEENIEVDLIKVLKEKGKGCQELIRKLEQSDFPLEALEFIYMYAIVSKELPKQLHDYISIFSDVTKFNEIKIEYMTEELGNERKQIKNIKDLEKVRFKEATLIFTL